MKHKKLDCILLLYALQFFSKIMNNENLPHMTSHGSCISKLTDSGHKILKVKLVTNSPGRFITRRGENNAMLLI